MALDPVIAGGFRGLQLQDPLEQYSRVSQIQQAQQQNQLAALKMQEYQREVETENRLRALYQRPGADIRSPEFLREVYSVSPAKGAAMQKSAFEVEKEKRLSDAAMEDLVAKRIANARQMLPSVTPETWGAWRADTIQKLPGLANMIPEMYSDDAKMQLIQTADQYAASRKPMVVAPGASVFQPGSTTAAFTAPAKPETPKLSDRLVPVGKLVFDRETRQFITPPAAAIAATQDRGTAAPAAPSAKPPTAAQAAKTEAQNQARVALSKDLQTVLGYYEKLTDIGGMVSPERTGVENIVASARTSGLGQVVERTTGTRAQTLRDNILNSRQRLLSHIKNATGASAQQMNSNVELQTWLNALTNPAQSIETVRETLGQLDTVIAGVTSQVDAERRGGGSPRPSPAPASDLAAERENARSAIAAGAPEAAVRKRFKEKTGQEL